MPRRIQRKRTRGWRMPDGAIYVGRPSRWGNVYRVGETDYNPCMGQQSLHTPANRRDAVEMYRCWLHKWLARHPDFLEPLRGRDLVCWCPLDQPCHADVLLELANDDRT